jgi:hypothetical protein
MLEIVPPQQVLAVVISVRRSHNAMNVLPSRLHGLSRKLPQVCGVLVVKLNQDHWTLHAVIKHTIRLHAANPREPAVIQVPIHLVHLHASVPFVHVAYVQVNQIAEALTCRTR